MLWIEHSPLVIPFPSENALACSGCEDEPLCVPHDHALVKCVPAMTL